MKSSFIGVNVGGWLIVEKWLTPSVFEEMDARDEWGLSQSKQGRRRIKEHRKTFICESDFAWLKSHGVEIIRLPVPFWAVVESKEYVSAASEVAWAMNMAEKYDLKVLLDLHAVPGGQNKGDHSGKSGQMEWFENKVYQEQTVQLLKTLAHQFRNSSALWGIEIMNEPEVKGNVWLLRAFYKRAYEELIKIVRPGTYTVFHDGFQPFLLNGSLRKKRGFPVAMDVHWYAFSSRYIRDFSGFMRFSYVLRAGMGTVLRLRQPVIVGEWSTVLPQKYFNTAPKESHRRLLQENAAMQAQAHRYLLGAMYWNYKAEGTGMWNFRWLVENGVIEL